MAVKRLAERVSATPLSGCRVDRQAGIVFGVLVCGTESANGRKYPWGRGLKCDPRVYEGKPVNCDHGTQNTVERRFGWLANVRVGSDGRPRADLHILKSHPMAGRVMEAAERNPSLFGMSHVAMARTRSERGVEIVEAITSVESVDIVASPATTKGLYESVGTRPAPTPKPPVKAVVREFVHPGGRIAPAPPPGFIKGIVHAFRRK